MKLRFARHKFSLLVALAVVASPGFAAPFDKGDVNGDGKPGEIGDAFLTRRISLKLGNYTDQQKAAADVFPIDPVTGNIGDGQVDIRDVLVFLQGIAQFFGPTPEISKHDIGAPIIATIQASSTTITTAPVTLTATIKNAATGEVTGVNWSVDQQSAAAGFTITSTGALTATLNPPSGGATPGGTVTVTATPTGPGVAGRSRTTAGQIVISTVHQQGGGG